MIILLLCSEQVRGYPTLKFFRNGKPMEYSGGRTADTIVSWLEKKTGPPALALADVEAAKKFVADNKVAVVGFFKDQTTDAAKAFLEVAASLDDYKFGITDSDDVNGEYGVSGDKIVLFKAFDEGKNEFDGEYTAEVKTYQSRGPREYRYRLGTANPGVPGLGFSLVKGIFSVPDSVPVSIRHLYNPGFGFENCKPVLCT